MPFKKLCQGLALTAICMSAAAAEPLTFEQAEPTSLSISHSTPDLKFTLSSQGDAGLGGGDAAEIARQSSNPLGGDFMVLINEWHYVESKSNIPAIDNATNVFHVSQPVIPIDMSKQFGEHWILVNRPTFLRFYDIELPTGSPPSGLVTRTGWGDISHFSLLGTSVPSESNLLGRGDRVLAAGLSVNIPVGDREFRNKWAAGPAAVGAFIGEKGILGALAQFQFDLERDPFEDYNRAFVQPFYFKSFGDGWQVGGAPLWTFNLDDDSAHEISVALGVQKTQVFNLGGGKKLPIRFGLEARHYVEQSSAFGSDREIVFSISPIIPNIVGNMIKGCPAMSMGGC